MPAPNIPGLFQVRQDVESEDDLDDAVASMHLGSLDSVGSSNLVRKSVPEAHSNVQLFGIEQLQHHNYLRRSQAFSSEPTATTDE